MRRIPENIRLNCGEANILQEKIIRLEKDLAEKDKELDKLQNTSTVESRSWSTQTTSTWSSHEDLMKENEKIKNDLNLKSWELSRVNDERITLKKDNVTLKQNIACFTEEEDKMKQNAKNQGLLIAELRKQVKATATKKSDEKSVSFDENELVLKTIDNKLEKLTTSLLESVTEMVDTKLSVLTKLETIPQEISENCNTFKEALTNKMPRNEFKSAITETKNDELVQLRERRLRSCNIIIHGVAEQKENSAGHDEQFIKDFLGALGVDHQPKAMTRLGNADNNSRRPLRITMKKEEEKVLIMARLPNLKTPKKL